MGNSITKPKDIIDSDSTKIVEEKHIISRNYQMGLNSYFINEISPVDKFTRDIRKKQLIWLFLRTWINEP